MKESSPERFVAPHVRDIPRSGIRDFFEIVSSREGVISLGIGEPDFVSPWHIREAAVFALDRGLTSYTSNRGLLKLRRALSRYVDETFGMRYEPETEILVTVGVSEALDLAIRSVLKPGDAVLYHEPCYVSYAPIVRFAHGAPIPVPTAGPAFELTGRAVEAALTPNSRVLMLNYPTNPTGAILSRERAAEIAAVACAHDLVVISDEIYSELTYEGERFSIASLPGMRERTIFLHGLSKAWAMTGFRIGYACAPPELVEAMMKIHQYTMLCAPVLSQEAAVEALQNGHRDVAAMREEYRRRRNFIHAGLNEIGLPCGRPQGAFYAFPSVSRFGVPSREFALRLLHEENVACVPGTAFGPSGEGHIRCAYAAGLDDIREALRRMGRFVGRLRPAST